MITSDPAAWILFAVVIGASVGFFACALLVSHSIRRDCRISWRDGYAACNRDHARRRS